MSNSSIFFAHPEMKKQCSAYYNQGRRKAEDGEIFCFHVTHVGKGTLSKSVLFLGRIFQIS